MATPPPKKALLFASRHNLLLRDSAIEGERVTQTPELCQVYYYPHEATRKSDRVDAARKAKFLWLRIHNNTPWTIAFPTESLYVGTAITPWRLCDGVGVLGLRDGLEVNAYYQVDSAGRERHHPPTVPGRIDLMPTSWLPPGRSVIFQVRREYVTERYSVYLPFNYEWEAGKGVVRGGEPEHRAYFYAWKLPKDVR